MLAASLIFLGQDSKTVDATAVPRIPATPATVSARDSTTGASAGGATNALLLPTKRHLRILFVGDSLRGAVYASAPQKGWVGQVIVGLERRGRTITELNATKVGHTPGKARGANDIHAVAGGADVAVLEIGTNDVHHVPIGDFAHNYRRLLAMIRRTSPRAHVMCLGAWSLPNAPELSIQPYNATIARACSNGTYFPLTDIWRNAGFHGPVGRLTWDGRGDAFHPNDDGYRAIATRVLEHIAQ